MKSEPNKPMVPHTTAELVEVLKMLSEASDCWDDSAEPDPEGVELGKEFVAAMMRYLLHYLKSLAKAGDQEAVLALEEFREHPLRGLTPAEATIN